MTAFAYPPQPDLLTTVVTDVGIVLIGYGLGCFSTGYYLTRLLSRSDIRDSGSGATGATNVGRILGTGGFIGTLIGDMAKGVAAMAIAYQWQSEPWVASCSLIAVMAGHIWPIQLQFRGGKAIAVLAGALVLFDPWLLMYWLIVFGTSYGIIRHYTQAGIVSIVFLPFIVWLTGPPMHEWIAVTVGAILMLYAHRANIRSFLRSGKPGS